MSEKLKVTELRKIVFAEMNVAAYRQRVFADLLAELDGRTTSTEETETVVETKTAAKGNAKGAKTKSAPVVEAQEDMNEVAQDEDDMFGEEAEEESGPTLDDVRKVVKDFATRHGKEKALNLLGKFKVTSIPDVKKADYAKVIELARKHL